MVDSANRVYTAPLGTVITAAAIAIASVALGAALALVPRSASRWLGPIRTFALTAALALVVAQLLPVALSRLGLAALGAFVLGLAVPALVRVLARPDKKDASSGARAAVEVGFVGLVVHRLGDGLAMGAVAHSWGPEETELSVILALAAHVVPVTAAFVLAIARTRGRRSALTHATVLAAASLCGVLAAGRVPIETAETFDAWVAAAVAGLLMDIVLHDLRADPPLGSVNRTLDFFAALAGLALAFIGSTSHHHGPEGSRLVHAEVGRALVDLTIDTAPMLLLGLALAAALQTLGSRIPPRWLTSGSSVRQAVRGAVVGAPIPLCSCSVLPVSSALRTRGAGPALVVAFLVSTPELGIETFALTGTFMGWPFAGVRLGAALVVAIVAALVVARLSRAPTPESTGAPPRSLQPGRGNASSGTISRWVASFDELVFHVGAWTTVGLVAAALVRVLLPANAMSGLQGGGLDVLVVSLVSIPSYVCASSATPLGAVLLAKGFSPGAVLAGLLLGPATNLATLAFLKRAYGARAALGAVLSLIFVTWVLALGVNAWVPVGGLAASGPVDHAHGPAGIAAAGLLVLLLARSVWKSGVRGWLTAMLVSTEHDHPHAHAQPEPVG